MFGDFTMCVNKECHLRHSCCRSEASGTKPMRYQIFAFFQPEENDCEYGVFIKEELLKNKDII